MYFCEFSFFDNWKYKQKNFPKTSPKSLSKKQLPQFPGIEDSTDIAYNSIWKF